MKLEDIREMETEPFDEEILGSVYFRDYDASAMMPDGFATLIFLYLRKFDERYGTRLTKLVNIEQVLPSFMDNSDELLWTDNIYSVVSEVMLESGWQMDWLMLYDERLHVMLEGKSDTPEAFHVAYHQLLDELYNDCFVKSCFLQEEEEVREMVAYLEEGEVCVMWNSNLERYKKYRKENKEVVAAICPEEDHYISILQEDVWMPFVASFIQKKSVCEDMTYCLLVLGCEGYNFFNDTDINPNWILKALKLGWMLRLALEKIDCYEDMKRSKEVV